MPAPTLTGLAARVDALEADVATLFEELGELTKCVALILRALAKVEPAPIPDPYSPLDIAQTIMDQVLIDLDVEDPLAT